MAKYLLLKHYRGAPDAVNNVPMDRWTPQEVEDHLQYMRDFADRLRATGEYVDGQALAPDGLWVRSDPRGAARPYAEAAHAAPTLAERHHLTRQAARLGQELGERA
nr:hypothetical protein [Patulibacter sp. SYSU D01012]